MILTAVLCMTMSPSEEAILDDLLPRNVAVATDLTRALLENAASEQGARMTAMDNATRNAGETDRQADDYLVQPYASGRDHQRTD